MGAASSFSIGNKTMPVAKARAILKNNGIPLLSKMGILIRIAPTLRKTKKNS
jgi:hypothetical protein